MTAFKGFDTRVFSTYSAEKWSSNVHNLARMQAKDIMVALCDLATTKIESELGGLVRAASDHMPNITNHKKVDAQWVYWFRGPEERKSLASFLEKTPLDQATIFDIAPQDKHATLAVILRESGLWVGLRVAPGATVDRRNLTSKLTKGWERERLAELLGELPEATQFGPQDKLCSTADVSPDAFMDFELSPQTPAWEIGHPIEAAEAIELADDLPDHVARWLGVFVPLYRYVAWSRDNDHIEATKQIQEEKAEKRRKALSYREGDRVRIIGGLFAGKTGTVEKIDAKAQVKIRVGKMSVVVSGKELTTV